MKRWAFLTAGLYLIAWAVLWVPFAAIVFGPASSSRVISDGLGSVYFWLYAAFLAGCSLLLLIAPVSLSRRSRSRGPLAVTVATTGFLLAWLVLGAVLSVAELRSESDTFGFLGRGSSQQLWGLLGITLLAWAVWAGILYLFTRRLDPAAAIGRSSRALFTGSVLELLVAIPSHVIVRQRTECCAGAYTFLGLVTGISVMLLAFGPGVYFLFAQRMARIRQPSRGEEPG